MGLPGTGVQLLIVVLFILPGTVYQVTRSRLRGPTPADQDATSKILRALAVSTLLNTVYVIGLGESLLRPLRTESLTQLPEHVHARFVGFVALLLLFVIPLLLGAFDYWRTRWRWVPKAMARFPWLQLTYDPTPRGWDYGFASQQGPCFVRVLTEDDKWVGGWWGGNSFAASYPEPLEIFLETAWRIDASGQFVDEVASSSGIYIRCSNAQVVEFLQPTSQGRDLSDISAETSESRLEKNLVARGAILGGLLLGLFAIAVAYTAIQGHAGCLFR